MIEKHNFKYKEWGSSSYETHTYTAPGCITGAVAQVTGDYYHDNIYIDLAPSSSACAKSNNSSTGYVWDPYACETIG